MVDLIYNKVHYNEKFTPICIEIPTTALLFKFMKACIGVKNKEDLWVWQQCSSSDSFGTDEDPE